MASLIGIFAAKCKNTCSLIMHIGLSVLLLAGFGVICILSGLWLGGTTVIGGFNNISLIKKKIFHFIQLNYI